MIWVAFVNATGQLAKLQNFQILMKFSTIYHCSASYGTSPRKPDINAKLWSKNINFTFFYEKNVAKL